MSTETVRTERAFTIVDLNYVTLYMKDYREAIAFYTSVFGEPGTADDNARIYGWRMGATWLTLFPSAGGIDKENNPRNTEFAVQVSSVEEVDTLYKILIDAGARGCMAPHDTSMYEPMRFSCVDDPFGVRIDVYAPRRA
jgi:predicted enzyme related to lactoylglutathione lyase